MRLPEAARADLLEFAGSTPLVERHLESMIDTLVDTQRATRRSVGSG